jgi:hypothetical protein
VILTYEDKQREDYLRVGKVLAGYLAWFGDFGEVEVISEGRLGPADSASKRPDLLDKARVTGRRLVQELGQ